MASLNQYFSISINLINGFNFIYLIHEYAMLIYSCSKWRLEFMDCMVSVYRVM